MQSGNFSEVNWGIIGCGDVCEIKSGPGLQRAEGSNLVGVMRRDGAKAKDFADRHGVPKWYANADELINDPAINAIYIATPPNSHEEYTLKAANAGKPVYVEKPMARSHKECQSMVDACTKAEVPLYVAYYRRALPNFLKIKELIEGGIIGDIRYVDIKLNKPLQPDIVGASHDKDNWRIFPEVAGGGYFYDLASHQLDMMDFLFGPIQKANGFALNQGGIYPAEDIVIGNFSFENNIIGQGTWCFNSASFSDIELTTIYGSKGQISFPFFSDNHVRVNVDGKEEDLLHFDISKHIQEPLIQTMVDELRGIGSCASSGVSGARTNWVMNEICQRIDL